MLLKVCLLALAAAGSTFAQRGSQERPLDQPSGEVPRQLVYLSPIYDNPFAQQQRFQGPLDEQSIFQLQQAQERGRPGGIGSPGPGYPSYLNQNSLYYSTGDQRDDIGPSQPGYVESIYNWILGRPQTTPPSVAPTTEEGPTPAPPASPEGSPSEPEPQQPEEENNEQNINEEEGRSRRPLKVIQPVKIEQLEPDAELIPQNQQTPQQARPQFPSAGGAGGFLPGQRFYILNPQGNQPQFFGSNPLIYPQVPGAYRPQNPLQINPNYQRYYLGLQQSNEGQQQVPQQADVLSNAILLGSRAGVPLNAQRLAIPVRGSPQQGNNDGQTLGFNRGTQGPTYQNQLQTLEYAQTPGAALPFFGFGRQLNFDNNDPTVQQQQQQQHLQYPGQAGGYPQFLLGQGQPGRFFNARNLEAAGTSTQNERSDPGNFLIRADSEEDKNEDASSTTTLATDIDEDKDDKANLQSVIPVDAERTAPPKIQQAKKVGKA